MSGEGRFILINGILCRTADDTGSFRPSDIFSGYNPNCFLKPPQNQSLADTLAANLAEGEIRAEAMPTISSICPAHSHFSVLSGGVLIDPKTNEFVDFTDTCTYNAMNEAQVPSKGCTREVDESSNTSPTTTTTTTTTTTGTTGERAEVVAARTKRIKRRIERNSRLYKRVCLEGIKAEAVLSLVSSLEPIGTKGTTDTPLTVPNTYPKPVPAITMEKVWIHNLRYMHKSSVLSLPSRLTKQRKRLIHNLRTTELFRLLNKVLGSLFWGAARSSRFKLQANGTRFLPYKESALLGDQDATDDDFLRTPSFTTAFIPISGSRSTGNINSYNRRLLQYMCSRIRSLRANRRSDLQTLYEPLHQWAVLHETEIKFLPPLHYILAPIRQLEWIFSHYFRVVGVKESVIDDTKRYVLSPDADYSVSHAVLVATRRPPKGSIPERTLEAIQTTVGREHICAVWLDLFAHSRARILRRLKDILRYLFELCK